MKNPPGTNDTCDGKEKESDYDFIEKYSTLPAAMKTNLLVGCKTETDQSEVQVRKIAKNLTMYRFLPQSFLYVFFISSYLFLF